MQQLNRIGLYGGTFDPLHNAHIELAHWVVRELHLKKIYFIPSARHPFKTNREITPPEIRFKMLSRVLSDSAIFRVSPVEIESQRISYTIDTINELRKSREFSNAQLYLIIGEDNLREFHLWKNPEEIFYLVKVIVLQRRDSDKSLQINPRFRQKMIMLNSPEIDISSTMIRNRVKNGKSVKHLIPEAVWTIIQKYQLYGYKKSGDGDY